MPPELLWEENPTEVLRQVDRNRTGFFARLGRATTPPLPGGHHAELYRTGVPLPLFNGVASLDTDGPFLEEAVGSLVQWGNRGHVPWCCWVSDRQAHGPLPGLLRSFGLDRHDPFTGLALNLRAGVPPGPVLPGFLVQRVGSETDRRLLLLALGRGRFVESPTASEALVRCITDRDLLSDPSLRLLVGLADGRPVGALAVFVEGLIAGVYGLTVDAGTRGRHFGTALLSAALRLGISWGCRSVVATVPATDSGLFRRLGFAEYDSVENYTIDPSRIPSFERDGV